MIEDRTESLPTTPPLRLLARVLHYARPYAGWMALSLTLLLGFSAVINSLPMILQRAVDHWLVAPGIAGSDRLAGLMHEGWLYLGLAAGALSVRFVESLLTAWIGQRIVFDLRAAVFRKAMMLDLGFYDRTPVGRLMTRVTSDVEAVQRFVTEGVVGAVADLFMLAGVVGFMLYVHPAMALVLLAVLPLMLLGLGRVNGRLRRANRLIRERTSALNALLQENLAGMSTIQLFNREARAASRFDERNASLRAAHLDEINWVSVYFPVLEVTQAVSTAVVLAYGGWALARGDAAMTLGVLVAFLAYVRDFFRPLGALSDKAGMVQQAIASSERLFHLLDTPEMVTDPVQPAELAREEGAIEFDRVGFAYVGDHWVLQDIDLRIRPGESVAIVGATGSGKSTIISLLARFYDVRTGAVRVRGSDVRSIRQRDLRRRIGLVLQEPFIFSGTIATNIALDDPTIPRERLEAAARYVNAHRFIARMPGGFDAAVGERGGSLSAGEKQLLALARVLVQNPEIVVVLDEATANVDTETERLIQQAVRKLMRGRTSLVIAHRLSTIRDADRILVMRRGRIAAQGSHDELMAADPYYRHLCELLARRPDGG